MLDTAATSSETDAQAKKPKPNMNKHKLPGSNVLFEFACDKIQVLEPLVQNMALKYIVCARETLTLRILRALNSSSIRSKLCQDVPSIAQSSASHGPEATSKPAKVS